ncbi:MAG: hypothetical protein KatS3mg052_0194 [Candidatus Roseilinea sp.]|nr:MAG: hypothetical protein KatS3mg052_0194 [Candidatus Roseilinea sp.]
MSGLASSQLVRGMLRLWSSPQALAQHPLARSHMVAAVQAEQGCDAVAALRYLIERAIELAWPHDMAEWRGRRKRMLIEAHYLRGEPLKQVSEALHLNERSARRVLGEALDDLAAAINQLEQRALETPAALRVNLAPSLAQHPLLIGREALLTQIVDWLTQPAPVVALWGMPGIGKSALLTYAANHAQVIRQFPDGVLWADLGPTQATPAELLRSWSSALGASVFDLAALGDDVRMLSGWVQRALADRRMLIVLNDVGDIARARALLLGGPACGYLIAAQRVEVAVALAPVHHVAVPLFSPEHARALLTTLAPALAEVEAEALEPILEWCGGLPLALVLVGRYLARVMHAQQPRRLRAVLDQLRDARSRQTLFTGAEGAPLGELGQIVQAQIAQLAPSHARALYSLAALPPRPAEFDETTVLAMLAGDVRALDALVDAGLLTCAGGWYSLHPVVRDVMWADARAAEARQVGQARLLEIAQAVAEGKARIADFAPHERALLLAAVNTVVEEGHAAVARALAVHVAPILDACGRLHMADALLTLGGSSGGQDADAVRLKACHARILARLGRLGLAKAQAEEALALAEVNAPASLPLALAAQAQVRLSSGDVAGALEVCDRGLSHDPDVPEVKLSLIRLRGYALVNLGRYAEGADVLRQALELARVHGLLEEQTRLTYALAAAARQQRRYEEAEAWVEQCLSLAQQAEMSEQEVLALTLLGIVANERGQPARAAACFARAEPPARQLGLPYPLIFLRHAQGVLAMRQQDWSRAEAALREALAHSVTAGWSGLAGNVSIELGECLLAMGRLAEAEAVCREGLARAEAGGYADFAALLKYVLARAAHARGEGEAARRLAEAALAQVQRSGHYRAGEIAAWAAATFG